MVSAQSGPKPIVFIGSVRRPLWRSPAGDRSGPSLWGLGGGARLSGTRGAPKRRAGSLGGGGPPEGPTKKERSPAKAQPSMSPTHLDL